ncbi:phosphoglycolate phosphatase-like HAD superfamily hydrolase [Nonomuraea fuscirosea]|uniref:Phosphoglycolate phosphatase-like HAD superfamily hydrolase n=1 Tax=Nonomuraea fuscirosea TaxID=1291556 RepID=A0A2T0LXT5_9ACTN|nr:haloacid dehalogenase-like hydrolase [Nonomuraea fuscirosea]PRX48933.1 phosphoglycolate phosphatase-like HAD superfamily hydrolase [Nonomuraea fuscirosea]
MAVRRVVLWDIDHTLIDTRGVGRELSAQAFEQVTGVPMVKQAKIDGITEPVIFRETAKLHGLHTERKDFDRFASALTKAHLERAAELRERGHALPGAASALDSLFAIPEVVQTVLTGNIRMVAEIKLQVFGLDRHIRWDIGAFGEDDEVRAELVRIALSRASAGFGEAVTARDAVLIGDTPADVEAALASDVPVIAVASGRSSAQDLHDAGAAHVLQSLEDLDALVALVTE